MKRIAQTIRLRPEHREEYLELHSAVWPGVEAALHRSNIRNYSIFLHGDVLFAYFEYHGDDSEADMAALEADPCQEPWPDRGGSRQWTALTEVWHLSPPPGTPS